MEGKELFLMQKETTWSLGAKSDSFRAGKLKHGQSGGFISHMRYIEKLQIGLMHIQRG